MLQAFKVEDELRAHELDSGKPIIDMRHLAFWGIRSTSVVVENLGFENEVKDVSVVLAAETAMLVNFGSSLE
jgi:hypothetical protein